MGKSMGKYATHYPSTNTLKHQFCELPYVSLLAHRSCTQDKSSSSTSTPDSLMVDLEQHLRGLAVTQPPKKRVRFTVQQGGIAERGGVHKPRLPTILLARIKNSDGPKPTGWEILSRSSLGISSSPTFSAPGASASCLPSTPSTHESWCRHLDSATSAEYIPSAPTSSETFLGVPLVETLELRDEAWTLLSARLWEGEVVDGDTAMEC